MRQILFGVATLLLGISGLATAQDTSSPLRYLETWANGRIGGVDSFHEFSIHQYFDQDTGNRVTLLDASLKVPVDTESFRDAEFWGCNIENNSVTVNSSRALFDAVVSNFAACEYQAMRLCNYTTEDHDEYECTTWTGPTSLEVTGGMANPVGGSQYTEVRTEFFLPSAYNRLMQCQGSEGFGADSGGFSFLLGDYSVYIPFRFEGGPGTADGDFGSRTCRQMSPTKKK